MVIAAITSCTNTSNPAVMLGAGLLAEEATLDAWCRERRIDYLPVAFPGFSWHNMKGDPLDAIPRLQGKFFWSQIAAAKRVGADMLYVAMFDEVDEGTAMFKLAPTPNELPVGVVTAFIGVPIFVSLMRRRRP